MDPALFLDRDGVIIENRPDYVRSWSDVTIYPQAMAALVRISSSPFKIVIVTNQSAVGRGLIPLSVAEDINARLVSEIHHAGGRVNGVFMCPHAPGEDCPCRKPRPGLLLQAAQALSLDMGRSILIGDALSDLQAGLAAGVNKVVLVRTGRSASETSLPESSAIGPFLVYDTLADALANLI